MGKVVLVDVEGLRNELDETVEYLEPRGGERWRAKLCGGVIAAHENGVVLYGNLEKLERTVSGFETDDADGKRETAGGQNLRGMKENGRSDRATVRFDGASRGNPGEAAGGYVVSESGVVDEGSVKIGRATNNEAEYRALIAGLEAADKLGYDDIEAVGDSQLVVKQVSGEWSCRAENLEPLLEVVRELRGLFDRFEIRHVPRESNERADELANLALDES
ncbi:MAG: reverse transcriptase-like protein [Halobacteria archaeon]